MTQVQQTPAAPAKKPKSLIAKAFWVLRYRPLVFIRSLRGFFLFELTRFLRPIFGPDAEQVRFGKGVRLQKLGSVQAEKPAAKVAIGDYSIVYENADIAAYGQGVIEIGDCAVLGDIRMASRHGIRIGKRFISSWNVFIQDFDPHPIIPEERGKQIEAICASFRPRYGSVPFAETYAWPFPGEAIEIGDDVWIGANCTILKGAKIGNGCIIATGAVVLSGQYPDRSIIGGNPARVVKTLDA